jgi:hypothetical protein
VVQFDKLGRAAAIAAAAIRRFARNSISHASRDALLATVGHHGDAFQPDRVMTQVTKLLTTMDTLVNPANASRL